MSGASHLPTFSPSGLLRRISLIITVSDLSRSVAFYRDKLGLILTVETSEWAEFRLGDARLALQAGTEAGEARSGDATGRVSVSFEVDDVVEAYEVLRAAGVRFIRPPTEQEFGALAILSDPDGCPIMLFEPAP